MTKKDWFDSSRQR
jgi:hypothetical protein